MNTTDTSTVGYDVIKFFSEGHNLQEDTKYNEQIILSGELVVKEKYLICMKEKPLGIESRKISNKYLLFQNEQLCIHVLML